MSQATANQKPSTANAELDRPLAVGFGDLLACPFCGEPPEQIKLQDLPRALKIMCLGENCVNPIIVCYDAKDAIKLWNTRQANAKS